MAYRQTTAGINQEYIVTKSNGLIFFLSLAVMAVALSGCGGSSNNSNPANVINDSNTGNVTNNNNVSSIGTITGFGSIFVNGIEFDTTNASFRIDDQDQFDDSALAVGMKVKVTGTINSNGTTGTATSVFYDDDVEGPIDIGSLSSLDAVRKTFTILGLPVSVHASQTVYDNGASFNTLAEGQKMEVSGYFDGSRIVASRIAKQIDQDDEYELKGTVASYVAGNSVALTLQNGAAAGPYTISATALLEFPVDPTGLFVELKLKDQGGGNLLVINIETDDADLVDDNDNEVSIRGILLGDSSNGFQINGIPFEVDSSTKYKPASLQGNLIAGRQIKVEGRVQGGVLIARELETEQGEIKFQASVDGVSTEDEKNGRITVCLCNYMLDFQADHNTQYEDSSASDLNNDGSFNLSELVATDFVEVEAYVSDFGQLFATSIERKDTGQDTYLEARIDSFVANTSVTFSLAGDNYTYHVHAGTTYKVNDATSSAADFFSALTNNSIVKVKDVDPADGMAEKLELEN